jgi:hypothetical protein
MRIILQATHGAEVVRADIDGLSRGLCLVEINYRFYSGISVAVLLVLRICRSDSVRSAAVSNHLSEQLA